jgi:hypothetical protein
MDAANLRQLLTYPLFWIVAAVFLIGLYRLVKAGLRKHNSKGPL